MTAICSEVFLIPVDDVRHISGEEVPNVGDGWQLASKRKLLRQRSRHRRRQAVATPPPSSSPPLTSHSLPCFC